MSSNNHGNGCDHAKQQNINDDSNNRNTITSRSIPEPRQSGGGQGSDPYTNTGSIPAPTGGLRDPRPNNTVNTPNIDLNTQQSAITSRSIRRDPCTNSNTKAKWPIKYATQSRLPSAYPNLLPSGDALQPRTADDGIVRFGFQNVNGISAPTNDGVTHELQVIKDYRVDVQGIAECNRPFTAETKHEFQLQLQHQLGNQCHTTFASALQVDYKTSYQPGGVMQIVRGPIQGRIAKHGTDKYGRFAWHCLNGSRDEGILVITGYRVCQEMKDDPGPNTACMQQYTALLKDGVKKPNPRKEMLKALSELIAEKRALNYQPILMLDANGSIFTDTDFRNFLTNNRLVDPYYMKFNANPRTYVRGSKRLDYIVMDDSLAPSIERIGILGSHEGVPSADHSYLYVDFREKDLFRGKVNRPAPRDRRQFTLAQSEKSTEFIKLVKKEFETHKIEERVGRLLAAFRQTGATDENIKAYNILDDLIFMNIVIGVANSLCRKDYGYMRSDRLIEAGRHVNYQKALLSCLERGVGPSVGVEKLAQQLRKEVPDLDALRADPKAQRTRVREARRELWEVQKVHQEERLRYLENVAQMRATIEGTSTEKMLENMKQAVKMSILNRKLTTITKGVQHQLDRIEIPRHEWYYSPKTQELAHYSHGVFETHAKMEEQPSGDNDRPVFFYPHHTLKVLEETESTPVEVEVTATEIKLLKIHPKESIWQSITEPKEIERLLMERNSRHLQQVSIEGGPSTQQPVADILQQDGLSDISESVVNGTYEPSQTFDVSDAMAKWIEHLQRPEKAKDFDRFEIQGVITPAAYQEMFKRAKETTSSAGPIHYTIWKCMAEDDDLAKWMSIMISLPFMFGFAPDRWKNMVDVMLEKKKGNRKIHMLRIIGLVAPDFNTALKHFNKLFSDRLESKDALSDAQWGCRPNRQAIDAAMLKLLCFESARTQRTTIACAYYDQVACFDRMLPSLSNILYRRMGMHPKVLTARAAVISGMRRYIRTAAGISEKSYGNEEGKPLLAGEIQGKADNPPLYNAQSSTMLRTHADLAPGLTLRSCTGKRCIHHHDVCYVDDDDGMVSAKHQPDFELADREAVENIMQSSALWNEIVNLTGQTIHFHKTKWQKLAWKVIEGQLEIITATEDTMLLRDHKGAASVIQFLPPNEPNKGLGFLLCPDGNQGPEYEKVMKSLTDVASACSTAFLKPAEARQALFQRLIPKIGYSLNLTSFTPKQCKELTTVIRRHFLPSLGFNRTTPSAVVHGPIDLGGLELVDIESLQDELQVTNLLKQLRWDQSVANALLVTIDNLQLSSGLTTPILEDTEMDIRYLDVGFISSLQARLREIGGSIWIEKAWTPSLQRINDEPIMERFSWGMMDDSRKKGRIRSRLTIPILKRLNAVRLYLRVITVADLADLSGKFVAYEKLSGDYRAESTLEWPNQPKPPDKWFAEFRKFFRLAFCWFSPPGSRGDFILDHRLGDWEEVPRNVHWPCYRSATAIYRREFDAEGQPTIQVFEKTTHSYYKYSHNIDAPPLDSHPVEADFFDADTWTWTRRPLQMVQREPKQPLPPGYITYQTTQLDGFRPTVTCSDGSVLPRHETAAAAWVIAEDDTKWIKACFLMTNISSLTSYRIELEGIFRALYHMEYLGIEPREWIKQWCDNKSGVERSNELPNKIKAMIEPEADLLLAIHHLKSKLPYTIHSSHVLGHQDDPNKKRKPDGNRDSNEPEFSNEALMNMACDELAGETAAAAVASSPTDIPPPTNIIQPPYPGCRAMLKIGNKWITSGVSKHINRARTVPPLQSYIKKRHNWSQQTFDSVHWPTIGSVRRRSTLAQQRFTAKIMHGWLPTGDKRAHVTGIGECPGCHEQKETIDHLFKCSNLSTQQRLEDIIAALRKKGLKDTGVKLKVWQIIATVIDQYRTGATTAPPANTTSEVFRAFHEQSCIGWDDFMRGYLAIGWIDALQSMGTDEPEQKLQTIVQTLWFEVAEPMWRHRNELAHGPGSATQTAINAKLDALLLWYRRHQEEVLPYHQQYLRRYSTVDDITKLKQSTKRAWIKHLKVAAAVWKKDRDNRREGLQLITRYFHPIPRKSP